MADTRSINRLLRGVSMHHTQTIRDAWRDLMSDPQTALPAVLQKLGSDAWSDNPRGPLASYFGVLLSLLADLDPDIFASEIDRLSSTDLHPDHRRTLSLMARRVRETPVAEIGPGIPVYISADLPDHAWIHDCLSCWAETPGLDLDHILRIDVIAAEAELDYLGRYQIFFSGIVLTWPKHRPRNPVLRWGRDLRREFTFYHEIGHHASGHLEGGSIEEQEDEADAYAIDAMRRAHPVIFVMFKPLFFVICRLRNAVRPGRKDRAEEY